MDFLHAHKNKNNSPFDLSVLSSVPIHQFKEMQTSVQDHSIFIWTAKKMQLSAHKSALPKSKLLSNLQVYEWRHQTEFPIIKTIYVQVHENGCNTAASTVDVTVFNEYCPLKLSQLYELTLSQSLYIFKESMLGFERLYTRFGSFEITDAMVGINEKGFCRVWLNQNFGLNCTTRKESNQLKMVNKIISMMELRTQQSKTAKKLFQSVKTCANFHNALKAIESYIKISKTIIASKFLISTSTDSQQLEHMNLKRFGHESVNTMAGPRMSIKQSKVRQMLGSEHKRERRNTSSSSPTKLERLKSQKHLGGVSKIMRISDLDTTYTGRRNGTPNTDPNVESPQKNKTVNYRTEKTENAKQRPWKLQTTSILMCEQQYPMKSADRKKKELTQSQAIIESPLQVLSQLKYSCKMPNDPNQISLFSHSKQDSFLKKIKHEGLLAPGQGSSHHRTPKKPMGRHKRQDDVEEDKLREQVSGSVLKNNGWVARVSGLLDMPSNLETSFHEGMEQQMQHREIKLEKLNNLGRQMLMSMVEDSNFNQLQ